MSSTLTPRQESILVGIATGLEVAEIARRLSLSERTVAYGVAEIKLRFGSARLSQAALIARAFAGGFQLSGASLSEQGRVQFDPRSVSRRSMGLNA